MYYTDIDGNKVLDGTAGLWCVNAGHGRKKIAEAVERQLSTLDYAPTFRMGHPVAFDFAARLAANAPGCEPAQGLDADRHGKPLKFRWQVGSHCGADLQTGFAVHLLPPGLVAHLLGPDSGFCGVLLAMLVGGMIHGGGSTSFSLMILLNEAGAGRIQLITLLTAWSVFAIHRVTIYEIPLMGGRFSAVRLIASSPLPLTAAALAWLMGMVLPSGLPGL